MILAMTCIAIFTGIRVIYVIIYIFTHIVIDIIFYIILCFSIVLQEISSIMNLLSESMNVIQSIETAINSQTRHQNTVESSDEKEKVGEDGQVLKADTGDSGKMEIEVSEHDKKDEKNKIEPVVTLKHLTSLTNSISAVYSNSPDSVLTQEILSKLSKSYTDITHWMEKTQLLLPQRNTRSKTNKDLRTTTTRDIEEVTLSIISSTFFLIIYSYFLFFLQLL